MSIAPCFFANLGPKRIKVWGRKVDERYDKKFLERLGL